MIAAESLDDVLDRNRLDERRRALRSLLLRPLLESDTPAFALVRRHTEWLREWLARETGWALQVEGDFARLHKAPADHGDASRGAPPHYRRAGATPFDRRRYALFCLALADLERGESQVTLGNIGNAVVHGATDPMLTGAGLRFELEGRDERRDLVAVVRLLMELRVLSRVAGDEESYIAAGRDVLYDVDRRVLAALLVTARGPSLLPPDELPAGTLERMTAVTARYVPDTTEARNRELRQRLTRRLLDDPVLYWSELDEDEHAYLTSQRAAIARRIEEATGLIPEVRAEGIAMVDPSADLTDERMPAEGTEGHITLLLAEHLAATDAQQTRAGLEARVRGWVAEYGRFWKKAAREPGAESMLVQQALERLEALRLVVREGEEVMPLPAIGRFKLERPRAHDGSPLEGIG
ncbi:TIGR02678 family protein [Thiohalomonas denitrificans]|uniref:TIGR02678 family protein n=1 Tax=Thiohalomonas denitrificans TaxID=415747 RepID=A0A1G5QFC7_9GAMM|nr:TIGR02678 family protein [Thiohalomonas denitrificans]SCZ60061.1 TIGR02678 family protein [Thiohalomonas denitrificans]